MVLIFGGGDGIPKGGKILENLLKSGISINIGIVSGKDDALFRKAVKLKERYNPPDLQVFGYVDFIYELLNISDFCNFKSRRFGYDGNPASEKNTDSY